MRGFNHKTISLRQQLWCAIVWGDSTGAGPAASRLDSEHLRFGPRTFRAAFGSLRVRETDQPGRGMPAVYWWRLPEWRKPHVRHETS
jgi:hypothetical protein